jgi:NADPH-dependent 2,4-dienoyl-CoA reductase/sulfur reductase-like enzyme
VNRETGSREECEMAKSYKYVIVGAQLAGASAAAGIREIDKDGTILLVGREEHLPYNRPPLSKQLWLGKKKVEEIFLHDAGFYEEHGVGLKLGTLVASLDVEAKTVTDGAGESYGYEQLLLATGGEPRRLDLPGGDLPGVCYYRALDDYTRVREAAAEGKSVLVIGGGFIGSEMAAVLHANGVKVTMVFGGPYLVDRVFPEGLGRALQADYRARGIAIQAEDVPISFEAKGAQVLTQTKSGAEIVSDLVLVGIGITPETALAEGAGLKTKDGIVVDEHLRASSPDVYAAGDNTFFPYAAIERRARVEHWDNAVNQGEHAGKNMAGANEPFTYMPYFFSDLFEFGYEAVGEVNSRLSVFADWQEENKTGVLYYLDGDRVKGVMMCNVWDKVDAARDLIREKRKVKAEELKGAIG